MRPSFLPQLINGPFDDPGLFVPLAFRKRALIFDLGDLGGLTSGDLIKTTHVFVSHTHMDHFIGFDRLLRLLLGRDKRLHMFGPPGFLIQVAAKLRAYTWNLVQNYDECLEIIATEVDADSCTTQNFACRDGFAPSPARTTGTQNGLIHREALLQVRTVRLDHRIPCLAFALGEPIHINILPAALKEMGLATGPWVGRFKEALMRGDDPRTPITVEPSDTRQSNRALPIGDLADKIARTAPGQKIAYVADAGYHPDNAAKIVDLARDADHLFIEAAFLHRHREIARAKHHLTAHQAGIIARSARVRRMTTFHYSPRYSGEGHLLEEEARRAFQESQ